MLYSKLYVMFFALNVHTVNILFNELEIGKMEITHFQSCGTYFALRRSTVVSLCCKFENQMCSPEPRPLFVCIFM